MQTSPPSNEESLRWCIVGGGLLGMTLAWRLAQRGQQVSVLEAATDLGGLADAWQVGDVIWDRHYHVTLLSDEYLRGLLTELGLERELHWHETRTGFFTRGQLHSVSSTWDFVRFRPLDLVSKLRLAWTIFYASRIRRWSKLESISVDSWLRRHSGNRTVDRFWLPLLRCKLGDNYRHTSAAFIWATIARLYAARRTGQKKEMLGYVTGGYRHTVNRFTQRLDEAGIVIRRSTPVLRVGSVTHQVRVHTEAGEEIFDRVVLTVPNHAICRMCPSLTANEQNRLLGTRYQGIICASLVLRRPLAGFYVTNLADPRVPFTGIIEMSALVDRDQLNGHHLVYLPWYVPSDSSLFEKSDAELEAQFWDGLRIVHPELTRGDLEAMRLSRVRCVMPVPTLHYSRQVMPIHTSLPGILIVNASQIVNGTLNVNETVKLAEESMPRLMTEGIGERRSEAQVVDLVVHT